MSQSKNLKYFTGSEKNAVQKSKKLLYVKAGILGAVIVGNWILFSLPVVFYYLQQSVNNNESSIISTTLLM